MIIPPDPYQYKGAIIEVPIPFTDDKFTYDGTSHSPNFQNFNRVFSSMSGTTYATTAGTYNVTFTLNNKRYFRWTDGTTDDKVVPWKIEKSENVINVSPTEMSLTYYNREQIATVSYYGDGALSYNVTNDYVTVSINRENRTVTVHAQKTGDSKIILNVGDGTNYLGGNVEINVSIDMTQIFSVKTSVDPPLSGYTQGDATVKEGTEVTVTATPNDGYKFVAWKVNGVIVSTNASYTFTPTSNVELVATLAAIPVYTVTVVVDPDGGGTATGGGEYREGTQAILNRTIADGYKFSGWFNGSVLLSTDPVYAFNVTSNVTITAKFIEIPVYSIVVSSDPESGGTASGGGDYREGTTVTLEYTMTDGYRFIGWKNVLTDEIVSTANPYTFTATESLAIIAKFEQIPMYTITVIVDPEGGGVVTGGGTYQENEYVTLSRTISDGYRFSGWYNGDELLSSNDTYTFVAKSDLIITAKYVEIPIYTVTATIDPADSGTVEGEGEYREGTTVTIKAIPADGYKFTGWKIGDSQITDKESYTFNITRNMNFTAVFEEKIQRLPAGYQEVEYISNPNLGYIYNNNSSAWIGRLPFTNSRVEISIKLPSNPSDGYFFGNSYINYSGTTMTKYSSNFISYLKSSNKIRADSGKESYTLNATSGIMNIVVDTPKGIFSVNESSTTISTSTSTASDTGYLPVPAIFSRNYARTGTSPSTTYGSGAMNFNLYSLKIYSSTATETGDLAFDFVPCINPSGLVGIYDVVRKRFWSSSVSSKPFVAGPSI